jgi:hypothetical protein
MNLKLHTTTEPHVVRQGIDWIGASGATYHYCIWPRGAKINGVYPGNFLHVKEAEDGTLVPVYAGQTEDLNRRLLTPEEQECIDSSGATQLHLHISYKGVQRRQAEQSDLTERWQPCCNPRIRANRLQRMSLEEAQRSGI